MLSFFQETGLDEEADELLREKLIVGAGITDVGEDLRKGLLAILLDKPLRILP